MEIDPTFDIQNYVAKPKPQVVHPNGTVLSGKITYAYTMDGFATHHSCVVWEECGLIKSVTLNGAFSPATNVRTRTIEHIEDAHLVETAVKALLEAHEVDETQLYDLKISVLNATFAPSPIAW